MAAHMRINLNIFSFLYELLSIDYGLIEEILEAVGQLIGIWGNKVT